MLVLKILILGGTNFLGPNLVEELHQRGHQVTLFNRGNQDLSQFPDVEKLRGDRDGNLDALKGKTWDAIIDTSGHLPRIVEASSQILSDIFLRESCPAFSFLILREFFKINWDSWFCGQLLFSFEFLE